MLRRRLLATALVVSLLAAPLAATWSIVMVDLRTGEVAVATATCLTNFDLRSDVTLVVPEFGAAAHQSSTDAGPNRLLNWQLLQLAVPVDEILQAIKDQDSLKKFRQIGIVSLRGDAVAFTGKGTFKWSGGVTGADGTLIYAVQGNVLTGEPVVLEAEQAILNTSGSLADRMLAGMEAAAAMGGDGRCSCSVPFPTNCGSPPPTFTKSAHIGTMLVARPGDPLEPCTPTGCSEGDFYIALNVAFAQAGDPDPIVQLRQQYEQWRLDEAGRPDALHSTAWMPTQLVAAGGSAPLQIVIDLVDLYGDALTSGGANVTLEHDRLSAGGASLLGVTDHGDGTYTLDVLPGSDPGVDRLRVVVDDGVRPVTLWPPVELVVAAPAPAPWNDPAPIAGLDGVIDDLALIQDGLVAYFTAPDARGQRRVYRAQRSDLQSPFGPRREMAFAGSTWLQVAGLAVRNDELELIAEATSPGLATARLHRAQRASTSEPFGPLAPILELDSGQGEGDPALSPDGLQLLFQSARSGGQALHSSWRPSIDARWMPPSHIANLDTGGEASPLLAANATRLYFAAGTELFESARLPGAWSAPVLAPGAASSVNDAAPVVQITDELWLRSNTSGELLASRSAEGSLTITTTQLSAAHGGSADLHLDAGPARANQPYRLLCGSPGASRFALSGTAVLPLTPDASTELCLTGAPPFYNFQGHLDAQGQATATVDIGPGILTEASLSGRHFAFAFFTPDGFLGGTAELVIVP